MDWAKVSETDRDSLTVGRLVARASGFNDLHLFVMVRRQGAWRRMIPHVQTSCSGPHPAPSLRPAEHGWRPWSSARPMVVVPTIQLIVLGPSHWRRPHTGRRFRARLRKAPCCSAAHGSGPLVRCSGHSSRRSQTRLGRPAMAGTGSLLGPSAEQLWACSQCLSSRP